MNARTSTVYVSLAAAILIPAAQKHLGITLSTTDVADLLAGAVLMWHGIATVFERYFPPPKPVDPAQIKEPTP